MSAQLQQAIINAHNAGDVAAAQRLGQLLKQQKQAAPQQAASPRSVPPHRRNQSTQPKAKDGAFEGYGDAFMRGIDQPLENMGVTAEALGAKGLGESLKGAVDERPGQSASGQFMNADKDGTFAYRYLPKAAVEQAGQFAGSLLARAGGAAVGGAVGNVPGAIAGGLAGPMMFEFAQQLGPIALERAKNNGRETPNKEDWTYATGTSAGVGALNAIAPGATGKIKRMLIEGVTEGTQSVGEQVGSTVNTDKGLEVDPRQAVAEGLIGGTSAGMVDTSVSTAKAAANLVRGNSKSIKNEGDVEAAASFAQRMANIANANGYDLKDIDKMSTKGARETVDKAHVQYTEELKQKFADLKSRVKVTDQDSLAEVEDKIMTAAAYREGRNKTKNTVGNQEMAALERLTGDTREGQEAMSILRQLNQLTEVHNDGYQGGVSQITDQFAPFGASVGYDKGAVATERLLRPLASGSAAITTGGSSLLAQAAAQGTGRLIDKVTGKRSKVANYIKENSGNQGIPGSNAASLRETNIAAQEAVAAQEEEARLRQEQYTEEERQANLRRVQQGAPPQQGSPEDIMRDATGLDRSGLAQVIRILKANPNTLPATTRAIEAYETSVATGGQVDFGLYRDINALVDQYPQLQNLMVRPRNAQSAAQGQAQQQLSQKEQNYQRGIDNNRAEAARITEAVNADSTIPVQQKAMLLNTLEEMQLDLGLNPVSRLQSMARRLEEKGVPGPTVEKYLGQYLQRVMAQQGAKEERDAAQDDAMEIDESREMSFTNSPGRISPAMPTGKSPLFDANVEKTPVSLALINQDPTLPKRIVDKMRPYVPFREAPSDDQSFLEQAVDFMKNNLVALYGSVSPEYRDRSKLWYVGANKLSQGAADTYGQTLESVAGVMSALSPGLDWYVNYDIGVRLLDIYTNHQDTVFGDAEFESAMKFVNNIKVKTPRQEVNKANHKAVIESMQGKTLSELSPAKQAYFVRFYDVANATERGHRIVTPEGELGDFVLNKNGSKKAAVFSDFPPIATAMAILANPSTENISALMGIGHKRRNFYNNILDPMNDQGDVTIDTHAVGAALFLPLAQTSVEVVNNFGTPDSKNIGSYGTYGVYAEAYRRAAEEVGILPREMQSITWEAARGLFPAAWKGQKKNVDSIRAIWEDYKNGKLSLDKARQTVYETAGNIRAAQWENDRPNFAINEGNVFQNDTGNIPGSGLSRGNQLRSGSLSTGGVPQSPQEIDLSAAPGSGALTQPESPQIPFDFTTPTVGQIKDKLEDAKDAVQMVIGKPGTKFEKGLSSYEDYKQLADLLDVSIGVYDSQKDFMRDFPVGEATLGVFGVAKGGVSGQVGLIRGNKEQDFIQTLAHEVSHALESRPQSNQESPLVQGRKLSQRHKQAAADKKSSVYLGSLRSKMRKEIFNETPVKDEIEVLQDGTVVSIAARPDLPGRPIRLNVDNSIETYSANNPDATVAQIFSDVVPQFRQYQSYIKGDAEFAVDPVMYYLINPKAMKKDMPNTFKFIQKHFNESNIPIKLYASPLATIVAILMAGMIGGEEEENPGILTPGPGMLSA